MLAIAIVITFANALAGCRRDGEKQWEKTKWVVFGEDQVVVIVQSGKLELQSQTAQSGEGRV
jgi:hypothetical protein